MFQQQTDLAISSRGPALVLTRTYNSLFAIKDGSFGYGWTHSYATYLWRVLRRAGRVTRPDSGRTLRAPKSLGGFKLASLSMSRFPANSRVYK